MASSAEELFAVPTRRLEIEHIRNQIEVEKERMQRNFLKLHKLLKEREICLLIEFDQIAEKAQADLEEDINRVQQLNAGRDSLECNLTDNNLNDVLEKGQRTLEDRIGELVVRRPSVGCVNVNVEWNDQAIHDICKIITLSDKPSGSIVCNICPAWWSVTRESQIEVISQNMQIAVGTVSNKIFIKDTDSGEIQVFDNQGDYLESHSWV